MGHQQSSFYTPESTRALLEESIEHVVLFNRPLVTLEPTTTLLETIKTFRIKNISCAPVVRSNTDFVLTDVVDIATFLSNAYAQLGRSTFEEHLKDIISVPCEDLADFSSRNPTITLPATSTVHTVLKTLQQHRATRLILLSNQTIHHIVTQSSLVEFALLNLDRLHLRPDASLLDLGFVGTTPVFACGENKVVLEVLKEMRERGVTAVPVVNSGMVMSGMMTVRHIKTLNSNNVQDLFLTVRELLKKNSATYITGTWTMSLRDLLRVMVVNTFHHLFFVNEGGKPTNVITLGDVLDFLFSMQIE
ncbi:uncharacterized protein SPPG_08342 [Spizellomyces punctatus DAOM BR117]|uniref:CBS domain-containing protein n=1 Tax=Spizellomyces punctatus (strain DAOM BR117) TaxID=645134 RepID=A0A0L0H4R0_SPIPD|nr:uncharacterized protein SPPG_08342 [Spizellomyces punctatus DAOM BR117]KNC96187.1 hypothetical protein SPPG_08342 [Spizellomyces punctatus DAOM BR117]|eukprot:XP_016604227.1 hypothetical protein SPPG_08342 [Spizellomyces punctatus DAOM BR117]